MEENRATTFHYAYINELNIVEQIVTLPAPISVPYYISIPTYDESLIGKRYNKETGEFEEVIWYCYVMLNGKDIVTEVLRRETQVPEPVPDYMIQIPNYDESLVGKWYNRKDGTFSEPPIHVLADLSTDKINVGTQDLWLTYKLSQTDTVLQTVGTLDQELGAHTENRSNPHGVTAQQVGADVVGSAAAVDAKLLEHNNDALAHNGQFSEIGQILSTKLGTNSDAKDTTVTFTEATTRSAPVSGETQATLWGQVRRLFTDLKAVAFSGSFADLSGVPSSFPPSTHIHDDRYSLKSITVEHTLSAASWSGSSPPYSYSFTHPDITATCPVELLKGSSMTAAQLEVLQSANIQGGTQVAGSIQLLAYGDKPTQNLPVLFVIRGDL